MDYEMEELLPIVARLTDQYTSMESSSVPYETARMLMESILYCLNECVHGERGNVVFSGEKPDVLTLYERGREVVIKKVYEAKERYESILEGFEDYGCRNYRDTILRGIPEFFIRYDAKFNPQEHLLTLDYPLIIGNPDLCGIDLIKEYLNGIWMEKRFLDCFDRQFVVKLLERVRPDYESLFLDNLCYPVLLNAIGCMIADKPIGKKELGDVDYKEIKAYFSGDKKVDSLEKRKGKIKGIIRMTVGRMLGEEEAEYFEKMASDYAVRIGNGIGEDSLSRVMI